MKARKIDLTPYPLTHLGPNPATKQPYEYAVKESLAELCFAPELKLTGRGALHAQKVAQAILDASGGSVLLDEMQYSHIAAACLEHQGFTRNDVELVRRVLDAPEVEVVEPPHPAPSPDSGQGG